ncbi:MAG TPA: diadenylate cyclase CdaA [Thermomicrobiales bacterium]|jgi:diadenylate cyclase|nr:diadenylate cyclase CdaA [Thermomicrobiales bacterium]
MSELTWLLSRLGEPRSLIDIAVVTGLLFWLLWVLQGTRATQLLRGAAIFLISAILLSRLLDLRALGWLIDNMWPVVIVAVPIIFQPELRRALEQLGHTGTWLRTSLPAGSDTGTMASTIDEVVRAAAQLSRLRYGALMVLERETGLQDYADRGVALDALVSRQLLVTIFFPNSPLHDAAVLLRGDRIVAGSVVLPLTDNISPMSNLGTRHRAGIGVTEDSDALAIIVSEETGQISVAHHGRLIRNLDQDRLRRVLRTLARIERVDREVEASGVRRAIADRIAPFADRRAKQKRSETRPSASKS